MSGTTSARRHGGDPLRRFRRGYVRYRRWLAAGSLGLAVATGVRVLQPPPPPTQRIHVVTRDLPASHVLAAADVETVNWPRGNRPAGLLTAPLGRVLAAPIRRGEPLTDARVTGPGLLTALPSGTVAITVRLSDPASALLLVPGRRVELLGGPIANSLNVGEEDAGIGNIEGNDPSWRHQVEVLATDALVLATPRRTESGGSGELTLGTGGEGSRESAVSEEAVGAAGTTAGSAGAASGVVVVAVSHETAERLTAVAGTRSITVAASGPS